MEAVIKQRIIIRQFQRQHPPRVLHLLSTRVPGFVPSELPGGRTYYLLLKYQVVS